MDGGDTDRYPAEASSQGCAPRTTTRGSKDVPEKGVEELSSQGRSLKVLVAECEYH
jgi:hypothetical protein